MERIKQWTGVGGTGLELDEQAFCSPRDPGFKKETIAANGKRVSNAVQSTQLPLYFFKNRPCKLCVEVVYLGNDPRISELGWKVGKRRKHY